MEAIQISPLTVSDILSPGVMAAREAELDRRLLNSPQALAQRVEVELIKNLKVNAPWLIPHINRF